MLTRASLVGRAPELAFVDQCLEAALSGRPRVVLCDGEAGIGKTRLAEAMLARARAAGALGAWGRSDDASGTPPYWPWRQVLRTLAQHVDIAGIANEQRTAADLARVAPEVLARQPAGTGVKPDDRFRQFDAIARLLGAAATREPLAIVLDDAHWADEASLLVLAHVAAGLSGERLLLWVTLRDSERPLGNVLERCRRSPAARQLHLSGLGTTAIREHLEALTGSAVSESEALDARRSTAGNPFFLGEFARMLADRRAGEGPPTVSARAIDAVTARLARLPAECIAVCGAAAILGHDFDVELAGAVARLDPSRCLAALAVATGAGVITASEAPGRRRFVHALVRDAIEASLGPAERAELHRRAAVAMEARHAAPVGPVVFELARHWTEAAVAGEARTAASWLERAGDVAMRQLAYEDAAHLYAEALRVGGVSLDIEARCRLLVARARATGRHGASAAAAEMCAEAAELARRTGRVELLADVALALEPIGQVGFDLATRRLCQEILAALPPEPTAMRARVTARFAETFIYHPDPDAAREASLRALAVAAECADAQALGAALRARQVVASDPEGLGEREELAARMLRLASESGDAGLELHGRRCRIDASFERGDLGRVAAELLAAARCADEIGGPVPRFWVAQMRAVLAQAQGRFAECRKLADEAFWIMLPTDHPDGFFMRGAVLCAAARHLGHDQASLEAGGCVEGPTAPDPKLLAGPGLIAALSTASALALAGRPAEADTLYRAQGPPAGWRPPPHVSLLTRALGLEVAVALDDGHDIAILRDQLAAHRGHDIACGLVTSSYMGPVELWLGKANRHLGRLDAAIADLGVAEARARAGGAAPFQVEAQVELAAAHLARDHAGDRGTARALLDRAAGGASRLGMPPWSARVRELRAALDSGPGSPLSPREREIAALVAEGLTNREIARRLSLSERTAQNHVQHILDKLALDNRSQVAVWVERGRHGA